MLLPALAQAREKARAISCVNNLKQIGLAVAMYADDSKEMLPATTGSRRRERPTDALGSQWAAGGRWAWENYIYRTSTTADVQVPVDSQTSLFNQYTFPQAHSEHGGLALAIYTKPSQIFFVCEGLFNTHWCPGHNSPAPR